MDDLIHGSCSSSSSYNGNGRLYFDNSSSFDYAPPQRTEFMETSFGTGCTDKTEQKVSDTECWLPKQRKVERKNLIIWDWDDTLFPTYSFRCHSDKKDVDFMDKLQLLVEIIYCIFSKMIAIYGATNIVIITNGSENWIHKCLNVDIVQSVFMKFQRLLLEHKIETISASKLEIRRKYPTNHYKWKEVVFKDYFESFFGIKPDSKHIIPCITSIGDSSCEYRASDISSKYLSNRILNRVLFKSNPSIDDMIFELKQILKMTQYFAMNKDDIDLDFSSLKPCVSSSSDSPSIM